MTFRMLAAAVALAAMTASARADITHTFFIEASDFTLDAGPGGEPPAEPVTVSLTVTFDPSKPIFATTSGLTVNAFSLPFKTEFAYSMIADTLVFGTDPSPAACGVDADSWCAFVADASDAFPILKSLSVSSDNGGVWIAQHTMFDVGLGSAVPEPSTWTLMLLGVGAAAWRFRRGRRAAPLGAALGS
ncbi:MAG TPA: PEP-CTERM sorting domain-containing protein [Roseiarcus sp.]